MRFKVALVIITLLSVIGFYNYHNLLSPQITRAMFMFMVLICGFVGWRMKPDNNIEIRYPRWLWMLLIVGLLVSNFVCPFYHHQSLLATFIASSTVIFAYLFLYALILLRPDPELLIKPLFVIAGLSMIVYFINFLTFPNNMFGEPILEDLSRGILRIRIPLMQVLLLLYFYSINKWHTENQNAWLISTGILFICGVLSVTRQFIAIMAILGFFQLLQKMSWARKLLIGGIIAIIAVIAYTQLPIFKTMRELSEEQIDATTSEQKEDVRISDWRYFGYEGTDNIVPLLFGNGTPSTTNSVWGRQLDTFMEENGWFMADTSWAACLYMYGYITTGILLIITIYAIFQKKSPEKNYLTYFFLSAFLQGIAWGTWFYPYQLVVIMVGFYLLYATQTKAVSSNKGVSPVSQPRSFITKL